MEIKNKISQVSIFVVISTIVVLVGIFLIVASHFNLFSNPVKSSSESVVNSVNYCLTKETKTGVFLLGFKGGFLNTTYPVFYNPYSYINLGMKVPIWDPYENIFSTIPIMQKDLNNYIKNKIRFCVKDSLSRIKDIKVINISKNIKVNSSINQNSVTVNLNLPIKFSVANEKQNVTISQFSIDLKPLRLGSLYQLAFKIYNYEKSTHFLEKRVLDQIYSAAGYDDPQHSMPTEGMSISCIPKIWFIPQLERNLINLNNNNFKYLQIDGTYNKDALKNINLNNFGYGSYDKYFNNFYTINIGDLNNPSFKNFLVNVNVPVVTDKNFSTFTFFKQFQVIPSDGFVVKPIDFKIDYSKIPIPCIQIYHELYNLNYPLMIKIVDLSPDGNGYYFQFPIRIKIYHNTAGSFTNSYIENFNYNPSSYDFCSNKSRKYPLTVYFVDKKTNTYLSGVNVTYRCVSYTCNLGKTEQPKLNGYTDYEANPYYFGNFPFCMNGMVIGKKNGYNKGMAQVTTDEKNTKDTYIIIPMIPTKEFQIKQSTFNLIDENRNLHRIYKNQGYIYLDIKNKGNNFEDYTIYPNDFNYKKNIKLLDGTYKYNITIAYVDKNNNLKGLMNYKNYQIDSETGNNFAVIIPVSDTPITSENFKTYEERAKNAEKSSEYGIKIY